MNDGVWIGIRNSKNWVMSERFRAWEMDKRIKFLCVIGLTVCISVVMSLVLPLKALSCPIPVFRYALEYWNSDPYYLEVVYEGSLTPEEEETLSFLLSAASNGEFKANLEIKRTDTREGIDGVTRDFLKDHPPGLPLMVLRYPRISGNNRIIWSGHFNRANAELLIHSPVRNTLRQRLVKEATAVWILLESGDRKKDQAALDVLERELRRLEKTLVLPEEQLWLGAKVEFPAIKFDVIRVSRNDEREKHLVSMLLNIEKDLADFYDEPIVFPVFGRGIALYGIVGKGINEWNIRDAAEFLTGPCSCQAKLLNPGFDLLISMDWDSYVEKITDINIANPLSGMGDFSRKEEEVKRLLESVTARRLGTLPGEGEADSDNQGRVVYLDLSGSLGARADEETEKRALKDNPGLSQISSDSSGVVSETHQIEALYEGRPGNGAGVAAADNEEAGNTVKKFAGHNTDKSFSRMFAIFGGLVLLIILVGTIIYLLTAKK